MRKQLALAAAALVAMVAPVVAGVSASAADAATAYRHPSASVSMGPVCRWNTGKTDYRIQLNNVNANESTQFQLIRSGSVDDRGTKYFNLAAGHTAPMYLSIHSGGTGSLVVKVPALPAGHRTLLVTGTKAALPGCHLDVHDARATIDRTTGLTKFNNAGDFIEKYELDWSNGGKGSYIITVPAHTVMQEQPYVWGGATSIYAYAFASDGSKHLVDQATVTPAANQ